MLNINSEPKELTNEEKQELLLEAKKSYSKKRYMIVAALLSFALLLLLLMACGFLVSAVTDKNIVGAAIITVIAVWVVGTIILIIWFVFKVPLSGVKKLKFKSEIVYVNLDKKKENGYRSLYAYSYNGKMAILEKNMFREDFAGLFEECKYGDSIYRYSQKKLYSYHSFCVFKRRK